ncbi:MAG TPA: DUF1801 domain-containing protein [Candidatus Dormibacteraeota bacterium]|nr:DUF1801 domain-containing protein [Candidatus Dormibacteraeota bacterium]
MKRGPEQLDVMLADAGPRAVDAYIGAASKQAQPLLRQLRELIRSGAPKAEERISYGMPYYRYHGHLMYFAAFKNHVGLFPVGNTDKHLGMSRWVTGKGTFRFPLDEPLPVTEIRRLVKTRVKENAAKVASNAGSARPSPNARSTSRGAGHASPRASRL